MLIAMPQIPKLQLKAQLYRSYTSDFVRVDPNQFCLRKLKRISLGTNGWKCFLPAGVEMELRLATERFTNLTLPCKYDSVKLPEGEHRISPQEHKEAYGDYVNQAYVVDAISPRSTKVVAGIEARIVNPSAS